MLVLTRSDFNSYPSGRKNKYCAKCALFRIDAKKKRLKAESAARRQGVSQGVMMCSCCKHTKSLSFFSRHKGVWLLKCSACKAAYNKARMSQMSQQERVAYRESRRIYEKNQPAETKARLSLIQRRRSQLVRNNVEMLDGPKTSRTKQIDRWLGCTRKDFKLYIESLFCEGMSWDNHGDWEYDHVVPLNRYDANSESDMAKAWHYTNLRPLWRSDNRQRSFKHETVSFQPVLMLGATA